MKGVLAGMMLYCAAIVGCVVLTGCFGGFAGTKTVTEKVKDEAGNTIKEITKTVFTQDYGTLNAIGGLAAFLAFGLIVARAFKVPVPAGSAATCILTAVGAWTLRYFLHEYTGVIAFLSLVAVVFGSAAFAYGHINWLERRLNVDLDRDGDVGVDGSKAPPDVDHPGPTGG